jgi:hypothetical protein
MRTLTERIREHNLLNGFRFVIAEYTIASLLVLPFAIYYFLHGRFLMGMIGWGLVTNFCVYIILAVQSIRRKEVSIGIGKLFKKETREEINRNYPQLERTTWALTATTLVPFLMAVIVLAELSRKRGK